MLKICHFFAILQLPVHLCTDCMFTAEISQKDMLFCDFFPFYIQGYQVGNLKPIIVRACTLWKLFNTKKLGPFYFLES